MLVLESKLAATSEQFALIDEAIRTFQFIRNKALRYWIDTKGATKAERAWAAVSRFFDNCKKNIVGKKGYPKFQKDNRSVEHKTTGWKLSDERRFLTITDGFGIGKLKLLGTRDLRTYSKEQIKRVRLVRRADGYYAQFCIDIDRTEDLAPTGQAIGLDMGLTSFYTDSTGVKVENPRYLRKAEKQLKQAQRRVSKKAKGSKNRIQARKRLGRQHLKVSRQRKDFAIKQARCVGVRHRTPVQSNDLIAIEDLKVRNMVKNHHLAQSISDASWSMFRTWLEYYGKVMGRVVIAMAPHYTSQECSSCHVIVKKSLSTRTHTCQCGCVLDRDHNAALNILAAGLKSTQGHWETATLEESIAPTTEAQSDVAS